MLYAASRVWLLLFFCFGKSYAQNSMTGDGFGGRSWYVPHNFQAGAYSAYTVCGNDDQLYGWGRNLFGELGNGTTVNSNIPVPVIGMKNVRFYTWDPLESTCRHASLSIL